MSHGASAASAIVSTWRQTPSVSPEKRGWGVTNHGSLPPCRFRDRGQMTPRPQFIWGRGGGGGSRDTDIYSSSIYSLLGFLAYSVSHHAPAYLRLSQAQPAGQLLPLRSDHIVILLEGSFQTEQLRGRECRSDAFGLPGERAMEEQVLRTMVLAWKPQRKTQLTFTLNCSISCH